MPADVLAGWLLFQLLLTFVISSATVAAIDVTMEQHITYLLLATMSQAKKIHKASVCWCFCKIKLKSRENSTTQTGDKKNQLVSDM